MIRATSLPLREKAARLIASLLFLTAAWEISAREWQLVPGASALRYTAIAEGSPLSGRFREFTASIYFDPQNLEASRFEIVVDPASVVSQDVERDRALVAADWFFIERFPRARFISTSFIAQDQEQFEVLGNLTIKGISRDLRLPFRWQASTTEARLTATTEISRNTFRIGEGVWADDAVVKNEVRIEASFVLRANLSP